MTKKIILLVFSLMIAIIFAFTMFFLTNQEEKNTIFQPEESIETNV